MLRHQTPPELKVLTVVRICSCVHGSEDELRISWSRLNLASEGEADGWALNGPTHMQTGVWAEGVTMTFFGKLFS